LTGRWIFEIKWDGFRTIAEVGVTGIRLYSRKQNSFNKRFEEIVRSLKQLKHEAVLDGEVVALDEQGHCRFEWLFSRNGQRKGRLIYYVFRSTLSRRPRFKNPAPPATKSPVEADPAKFPGSPLYGPHRRARQGIFPPGVGAGTGRDRCQGQAKSIPQWKRNQLLAEDQKPRL
jgi:hypothetical protein